MSDKIDNIVIPILRGLQSDMAIVKESIRRIDGRMSSMDHYMAGFYSEQHWQNEELYDHKKRLEKLEDNEDPGKPNE